MNTDEDNIISTAMKFYIFVEVFPMPLDAKI